jgi:beta-lactamase class C
MRARILGVIFLLGIIVVSLFISQGSSHDLHQAVDLPAGSVTFPDDESPFDLALDQFDDFLRKNLDSTETVGAAATVLHKGEIVYTLTYGVRRAGTTDSVDLNTVFRLASVSKGFAGLLACKLHFNGKLDLNERVITYLPDFELKDSVNTHDLAIRHLMSHTSGLVPHAFDNLAEAGQGICEILPRLEEVDIAGPPGMYYGYQNVLFSLLDTIARVSLDSDYPTLLKEQIFQPLGMDNASAGYRDLIWNSNVAFPHIKRGGEFYPLPLHTGYYNLLPAAGVNASIADMGKWLGALLGSSPLIIDPYVTRMISTPEINTPLKRAYTRQWDHIEGRYYSFGWRIFDYKGCRIIYHGGYVRGYRAELAFCPELETGIAFLQNSPNGVASRCVPTFFNLLLDRPKM